MVVNVPEMSVVWELFPEMSGEWGLFPELSDVWGLFPELSDVWGLFPEMTTGLPVGVSKKTQKTYFFPNKMQLQCK